MTLLQPAKFFAAPREGSLHAQAAHVKDGTLVLMSKLPESAAEAERSPSKTAIRSHGD